MRVLAGDGVGDVRNGETSRARFADPFGLAVDAEGAIYVADGADGNQVRVISPTGDVFTLAGGAPGFSDGSGYAARFSTPSGIAIDQYGTLYVADTGNNAIRRVTRDGQVSTVAGTGVAGFRDGPSLTSRFNAPIGLAVDAAGR